jgi:hypothetical protein
MSKVFAEEYRETAASDAPDLWARIEAGLDEIAENAGIRTARDVDFAVEKPETVKLEPMSYVNRRQFFYRYGGLIAACLCVAAIAPLIYFARGISYESDSAGTSGGAMLDTMNTTAAAEIGGWAGDSREEFMDNAPVPAPSFADSGDAAMGEYDGELAAETKNDRELQMGEQMAGSPSAGAADGITGGADGDMAANASNSGQAIYRAKSAASDFEMRLFTNKEVYRSDEAVMIWASLEYTGADDNVAIWSSGGYIVFSIYDDEGFYVGGILNGPRKETKLKKGEVYSYSYDKGNLDTFAPEDDRDYWEAFFSERDLYLPAGEYTVVAAAAFSLSEDMASIPSGLRCEMRIRVE